MAAKKVRVGCQRPSREYGKIKTESIFRKEKIMKTRLKSWGISLLDWQEYVLAESLKVLPKSKRRENQVNKAFRNVGLSVPRQNGKSEILIARILLGLVFLSEHQLYTSYDGNSCDAVYKRCLSLIESSRDLKKYFPSLPSRASKIKLIESRHPQTGKVLGSAEFITRGGGAGRGKTIDVLYLDEAQELTVSQNSALTAVTSASREGQIWYVGTPEPHGVAAVKGVSAQTSTEFTRYFSVIRKQVMAGTVKQTRWFEWGVDKLVPKDSRDAWFVANPSLNIDLGGGRGLKESALAASSNDDVSFAIEHLGWWSEQEHDHAVEIELWDDCTISDDEFFGRYDGSRLVVSLKSDDSTNILYFSTAWRADGFYYVAPSLALDLALNESNERLRSLLYDLMGKDSKLSAEAKPVSVIVDGHIASTQCHRALQDLRLVPLSYPAGKSYGVLSYASTGFLSRACFNFALGVRERIIQHPDNAPAREAIFDAGKRLFRSGWGFRSLSGKTSAPAVEGLALAVESARLHLRDRVDIHNSDNVQETRVVSPSKTVII